MKGRLLKVAAFLLLGAIVNVAVAWGCGAFIDVEESKRESGAVGDGPDIWLVTIRAQPGAMRISKREFGPAAAAAISPDVRSDLEAQAQNRLDDQIPRWSAAKSTTPPSDYPAPQLLYDHEDARGWPILSLQCALDVVGIIYKHATPPMPPSSSMRIRDDCIELLRESGEIVRVPLAPGDCVLGGLLSPQIIHQQRGVHEIRVLPCRPIWPGFAINTIFYAAVMWLLFAGPFAFRRWRRWRLCRCVKCGYDLRGRGTAHERCPECGVELCP